MSNKYKPETCDHCGQHTTYLLALDKGSTDIVIALAAAIKIKGINCIHPTKEMEVPAAEWTKERAYREGKLTSTQIGNLTRPRSHGLIAKVSGQPGNWCLTRKGAKFLAGHPVSRYAIMQKSTEHKPSHQIGYYEPEENQITLKQLKYEETYWDGYDYEIVSGSVIHKAEDIKNNQPKLI